MLRHADLVNLLFPCSREVLSICLVEIKKYTAKRLPSARLRKYPNLETVLAILIAAKRVVG